MVHFSGKARKMNHIPPFCERSEQENLNSYNFLSRIYSGLFTFNAFCVILQNLG
ncbi:MAG: hypothetical protein U5L45_17695 [Saprospiraceae bacterium]|nr:hypothetical protein [Saprospiraceae bacterium]